MRPGPIASQAEAGGSSLLNWTAETLGAGAVTYVEGAGLGWLFSNFGVDMAPDDSAQVLAELQQISAQLTALQGDLAAGFQETGCNVDTTTYSDLMDGSAAIAKIDTINGKLRNMAGATSRAEMLTYVNGDGGINDIFSEDPGMVQEIRNLIFGTAGADGSLQLYSNLLTTCHNYFNQTDSNSYVQVWNDGSGLLTAACAIDVNYYRYNASIAPSSAERSSYLTTAASDATACQGYAQAMLNLKPNIISNASEVIACSSPASGGPCGASDGIGWQLQANPLMANCGTFTFTKYGVDPVCAVDIGPYSPELLAIALGDGSWMIPAYSQVQSFLGSCATSYNPGSCLAQEGWGLDGQTMGGDPNIQLWTYTTQWGQPGEAPTYWADGGSPWQSGWCATSYYPVCSIVGLDGNLAAQVNCDCPGSLLLFWGGVLQCYWWCSSDADAAATAVSQGETNAASVSANPPQPPSATPQPAATPRPAGTSTPSPTETSRPLPLQPRARRRPHAQPRHLRPRRE
jgi:hypothetical protein